MTSITRLFRQREFDNYLKVGLFKERREDGRGRGSGDGWGRGGGASGYGEATYFISFDLGESKATFKRR